MKVMACMVAAAALTMGVASPPSPVLTSAATPAESVIPGFLEMEVSMQMMVSRGKTTYDQLDAKQKYLAYVNIDHILFAFIQDFPGGQPKKDVVRLEMRDGKTLWVFDDYSKLALRLRKAATRR